MDVPIFTYIHQNVKRKQNLSQIKVSLINYRFLCTAQVLKRKQIISNIFVHRKYSFKHLNNYFRLHVCLSFRTYIRTYVCHTFIFFDFLQLFHKMLLIQVAWHVLRMKNMHPGSSSDPSGTAGAGAKLKCV